MIRDDLATLSRYLESGKGVEAMLQRTKWTLEFFTARGNSVIWHYTNSHQEIEHAHLGNSIGGEFVDGCH